MIVKKNGAERERETVIISIGIDGNLLKSQIVTWQKVDEDRKRERVKSL